MTAPTIGVLGAGVIGSSVAHAAAAAGYAVTLVDSDATALDTARTTIRRHQRLATLLGGTRTRKLDIRSSTNLAALTGVELVVENTTESEDAKRALYPELERVLAADTTIAANTSAVPIGRLAEQLTNPGRVVGVHFMNPVDRIDMVEVVRGKASSDAAMADVDTMLRRMGKQSVVVEDAAGFVINRILMPVVNLAAAIVSDKVATPSQVDDLFKGCLGHKSGPLRTADLIGIDTVVHTLEVLHDHYGTDEFVTHPALRRMVDQGLLGIKSGRGFYSYDGN
ncbi:3-hydroxyacyl-CoA dehydrogenase family protein [Streptomyces sp. ok210]|jgi:3-hydroxybutyryl-CoA dehydrogenase|uniref:3-hydroxyacyl-CoA dehydrogenase family protein n=1 Tax=Streptomyces sp. ok210 TaxID=1761905 RepID=UPI0008F3B142|nr:3-hydroxyacyl-CoA dehydrogenase family protein [Streptomyces sp. ok210]SFT31397.1 3-hydroxybutyryl-CoA dehydrogenase [Streptomyces sp. ok210]